jgi:hypothetical protein
MQKILELISKSIKEFEDSESFPKDGFDEGIIEGMSILQKRIVNLQEKQNLEIIGVCGVCNNEYPTYKQATECCMFAKGKGYGNEINPVFQMRRDCRT